MACLRLPVISPLPITGAGAKTTSIERPARASTIRLLHVAVTSSLILKRLTLRGGEVRAFSFLGSCGSAHRRTLSLTNSTIAGNEALDGGSIINFGSGTIALFEGDFAGTRLIVLT